MLTVATKSLPGGPVGFLFAPPFDVDYYAACAISRIHPDAGMRPIVGYILALLVGLVVIILVPWFSIGFL